MINSFITYLRKHPALVLFCLLCITYVSFLSFTNFNTKGEPREAVVALSMINSADYILPVSNGADIPYKPPMFAWLIALFSWLTGGYVSEFTSRLPSALAMIAMTMAGFRLIRKREGVSVAFLSAMILATSFEVHRAATNCRVDMVLTAFMVGAIYRLFVVSERRVFLFDFWALLLMSCGVLTKGPVGAVLPCGILWIYCLAKKRRFWPTTCGLAALGVGSLIIPLLWYIAAYKQGGQAFLDLVIEENFGRFTGTMSYGSHENPWWYNLLTLSSGMLPYTLTAIFALVAVKWRILNIYFVKRVKNRLREADSFRLFMWISIVVIFVFYCIPKSKRSVYLLPMYPMLAFEFALMLRWLCKTGACWIKFFACFIASLALVVPVLFFAVKLFVPEHLSSTNELLLAISNYKLSVIGLVTILIAFVMGIYTLKSLKLKSMRTLSHAVMTIMALYWSFSAAYQPAVLNYKSDIAVAKEISAMGYGKSTPIKAYLPDSMMRYYTLDFYLNDKLPNVDSPEKLNVGTYIIGERDYEKLNGNVPAGLYLRVIRNFGVKSCDNKQKLMMIEIVDKE